MGVSRQTITKWKMAGKFSPDLDGRFCPKRAASSVLKTTDPNRVRARILKDAAEDAAQLRADVERLTGLVDEHEATIFRLRQVIARFERDQDEADRMMEIAPGMLAARWDDFEDMGHDGRRRGISNALDDALISASNEIALEIDVHALGIVPHGPASRHLDQVNISSGELGDDSDQ
ncbi:MAG: hypothetical protein WCY71_00005 [Halothiobacillaceae bacterium]